METHATLPSQLTKSLCYISYPLSKLDIKEYPCWAPQREVSVKLFGFNGGFTVDQIETIHGKFVWATEFSNVHSTFSFDEPPMIIDNVTYTGGPEQYYQLSKSIGTTDEETARKQIMSTSNPMNAYILGNRFKLRNDWEDVKEEIMRKAVTAKFTQNENLKSLLLSTKDFPLVQIKPGDNYWGTGPSGDGKNVLGKILMELRDLLLTKTT